MASLAEIRAKLESMENNGSNNKKFSSEDNALYAHWNIAEGASTTIRFLPDKNPDNVFFWAERQMIRLPFPGVIGGDEKKPITVQVPCGEMYGDTCPVLTEVRPMFKDKSLEDMARTYWKKRSYLFQGFVTDGSVDEEAPANPIRRFMISPQIFNIIKSALMDPDMENLPTDYVNGTDFRITKTQKGQYADYNTSKWARKERSLTEEELAAIEEHGLNSLDSYLPAQPTQEHYAAIAEMFEASINGEMYDPARWGNFYKPYGVEVPANAPTPGTQATTESAQPTAAPAPAAPAQPVTDDIPFDVEPAQAAAPAAEAPAGGDSAQSATDILAMIRKRSS